MSQLDKVYIDVDYTYIIYISIRAKFRTLAFDATVNQYIVP